MLALPEGGDSGRRLRRTSAPAVARTLCATHPTPSVSLQAARGLVERQKLCTAVKHGDNSDKGPRSPRRCDAVPRWGVQVPTVYLKYKSRDCPLLSPVCVCDLTLCRVGRGWRVEYGCGGVDEVPFHVSRCPSASAPTHAD